MIHKTSVLNPSREQFDSITNISLIVLHAYLSPFVLLTSESKRLKKSSFFIWATGIAL